MSIWRGKGFKNIIFDSNYEITDYPLWVNACGEDYILMNEEYQVDRVHGRNDYQMLYIKKGYGHFLIKGKMQKVTAPSIVLYKPHERQNYIYEKNKNAYVFWIHFSVSMVEHYLNKYRINYPLMKLSREFPLYEACVNRLLVEIQSEFSADICGALLHTLLIDLSRVYSQTPNEASRSANSTDMLSLMHELMQRTFAEDHTVKHYADMCDLTEIHFIKIFREKFGITPHRYIIHLRIDKASQLLMETTLSVQAIANSVGFENAFYFSRLFKSITNLTPTEFRKKYIC